MIAVASGATIGEECKGALNVSDLQYIAAKLWHYSENEEAW